MANNYFDDATFKVSNGQTAVEDDINLLTAALESSFDLVEADIGSNIVGVHESTYDHTLLHAESHTIVSHSDTTATGDELETLTDGSDADLLHTHPTNATDADLTTHAADTTAIHGITDTSDLLVTLDLTTHTADTTAIHGITNTAVLLTQSDVDDIPVNGVTTAPISSNWAYDHDADANAHHNQSHTIVSHSDTTATGDELETLTNDSMADALHRHSELSASDGLPNPVWGCDNDGHFLPEANNAYDIGSATLPVRYITGQGLRLYDVEPHMIPNHYNGTLAAPTKTLSGDDLFTIYSKGYDDSLSAFVVSARITFSATQNWTTGSNNGSEIKFTNRDNAGAAPEVRMTIKHNGVINIGDMPTSSAGLVSGDLWSDSGTIKIIA